MAKVKRIEYALQKEQFQPRNSCSKIYQKFLQCDQWYTIRVVAGRHFSKQPEQQQKTTETSTKTISKKHILSGKIGLKLPINEITEELCNKKCLSHKYVWMDLTIKNEC